MKAKIIMLSVLGVASFGLTQAANAGWDSGACAGGGPAPCIQWSDGSSTQHFNGSGGHADVWHGHPSGGDFTFSGTTDLSCPSLPAAVCTLTLNGQVKKFQDPNNDWRVGIRVNSGSVSGSGLLCGIITVGGFPWYLAENNTTTFDEDSGVVYSGPGPYTGAFGEIDVNVVGSDLRINNVVYDNSTFSFDDALLPSDCTVEGDLVLDNGETLEIF